MQTEALERYGDLKKKEKKDISAWTLDITSFTQHQGIHLYPNHEDNNDPIICRVQSVMKLVSRGRPNKNKRRIAR